MKNLALALTITIISAVLAAMAIDHYKFFESKDMKDIRAVLAEEKHDAQFLTHPIRVNSKTLYKGITFANSETPIPIYCLTVNVDGIEFKYAAHRDRLDPRIIELIQSRSISGYKSFCEPDTEEGKFERSILQIAYGFTFEEISQ